MLVVLRRVWEVFGRSERVWNGFRKFSEGLKRFLEDFKGPGGDDAIAAGGNSGPLR